MPIAPGIYTINSVAEKGPLYYDPSGDSFIVGTQGTKVCSMTSWVFLVVDYIL